MNGPTENSGPTRPESSLLRAGLWLALVLTGAKGCLLGGPATWSWPLKLAAVSFADVLFAVGLGATGAAMMRIAGRTRLTGLLRGAVLGFMVLSVLYAVIGIGVFDFFHRHLSFGLIRMFKGVAVFSSIGDRISVPILLTSVCLPAGFFSVAITGGSRGRWTTFFLGAAFLWISIGWGYSRAGLPVHHPGLARLGASPHIEIIRSAAFGILGKLRPALPKNFPAEDMLEFRPHSARGGRTGKFFEPSAGAARPRNVIVVVLESVATKYMSLYGCPYETTPNLSAESRHAVVFDNFYSHASFTSCSFVALNFSIYPALPWCYAPWAGRPCPPTLASHMRQLGARTAYLHNGDLFWGDSRGLLEGRGFDTVEDYRQLSCTPLSSWGAEDRRLFDRLIQWIDEKPDMPFFTVCWTDQTHDPYFQSPGVTKAEFMNGKSRPPLHEELDRYLNTLREVDRQLGRLFAALRERGLADDTLVVITGDHGEGFFDPHDNRGHSLTVYEEETHVPFILWNPRLFSPGRRVAMVGGHVDMNPTIADILGVEPLGGWQGHSMFDPGRPPRTFFMTHICEDLFGVRDRNWKYILNATGNEEMLFDLSSDPEERSNLAMSNPAERRRLQQRLAAWLDFEDRFLRGKTD